MSNRPTPRPTSTASVTINPQVSVSPSHGLRDGEIVTISARGFGPNQSLVAIECVDLGARTGQSTCDISGLTPISIGAAGTGATNFTVSIGPIGADNLACTSRHPCILSVSQATLNPTQTASAPISFG